MDILPYQVLFLIICIGVGVYLNRRNFAGTAQQAFGVFVPRPLITSVISFFIGLVMWIIINYLLLQFRIK